LDVQYLFEHIAYHVDTLRTEQEDTKEIVVTTSIMDVKHRKTPLFNFTMRNR